MKKIILSIVFVFAIALVSNVTCQITKVQQTEKKAECCKKVKKECKKKDKKACCTKAKKACCKKAKKECDKK